MTHVCMEVATYVATAKNLDTHIQVMSWHWQTATKLACVPVHVKSMFLPVPRNIYQASTTDNNIQHPLRHMCAYKTSLNFTIKYVATYSY